MNRRELLHILGGAAAVPVLAGLTPDRLLALGRALHKRARATRLRVLDPHQSETVAAIAELIIPATDTPGARAAKVHEFIDLLVAEWATDEERARFVAGLADVDARSRASFGRDFTSCTESQQATIVGALDAEVTRLRESRGEVDKNFFHHMKWLTVYGYYTSEIGITVELKDPIIPGRYDPCVATGIGMRDEGEGGA